MAALQHVYVTAHGQYTDAAWTEERAQFGLRLCIADVTAQPAKGSQFSPLLSGDVVGDSGSETGTHGTLTRTWTARLGPVGSTDNADAAWQIDLAEDVWIFLDSLKTNVDDGFRWTHVKIAPILASGQYGAPAAIYQFTTAIVGQDVTKAMPPECAIAVTWRANVLGRRGRGRIYMPGFTSGNALNSDGTVSSGFRTTLSSNAKTMILNLDNPPGTPDYGPIVAVMSAGSSTAVRPAQVRVGSHWDSQRRRQQQMAEQYTDQTL